MIKAEIVAHSLSPQGDELISVLCTFPRIILAEVNTHRMLSKNTSSSRAIPFHKMVKTVQENPFIPITWQKDHKGMQGNEYLIDRKHENAVYEWLKSRDYAVKQAKMMNNDGVTKQLCNRLLEPFMWTTMLITGSKEGWDNFFNLRCPSYFGKWKSWRETCAATGTIFEAPLLERLQNNKGQAEIHMMALAEAIYDAVNESTPKQLKAGEWHIPFANKLLELKVAYTDDGLDYKEKCTLEDKIAMSVAMAARTSYTVVGHEKELNAHSLINLHDRLLTQTPPHSSPLEHCARAMSDDEYFKSYRGNTLPLGYLNKEDALIEGYLDKKDKNVGWCGPYKGFIPYRYMIDNKTNIE